MEYKAVAVCRPELHLMSAAMGGSGLAATALHLILLRKVFV